MALTLNTHKIFLTTSNLRYVVGLLGIRAIYRYDDTGGIDHRAATKHILHTSVLLSLLRRSRMILCHWHVALTRSNVKRVKVRATGTRPELPPLFAHKQQHESEGCFGCFWFEPELYV